MAQPKVQLETFKAWAGLSSDINYYLNRWGGISFQPLVAVVGTLAASIQPCSLAATRMAALTIIGSRPRGLALRTLLPPSPNSHHIDIHNWMVGGGARPVTVTALAAAGVAEAKLGRPCEDTITLSVKWENDGGAGVGTAVYTASWIAPKVGALCACFWGGLSEGGT